jgi:hypothetical protein
MVDKYTHTGRKTLEESYGAHFPDSRVTNEPERTRPCRATMQNKDREDWNLSV